MAIAGLAFIVVGFFGSLTFGALMAWLIVRKTRKPVLWALTPAFALIWLVLAGGSLFLLGTVTRAKAEARMLEQLREQERIAGELAERGRAAHEATDAGDAAAGPAGENE